MINVLVVDDQNLTHRLVETYLKPETEINIVGFADDGQEAIEKIPQLQPDVILMDVEMPKMDGLTATKIITRNYKQIKIVILTVYDNEQHLITALQNGAKGYLLKTTTPLELKNSIYYANQGYFQLSVELIEKYLYKVINTKPQSDTINELKNKINYLYKSLNKLEGNLQNPQDLSQSLESKLDKLLHQEMALLNERDSHLQYKVDRMKHTQERLQKNINYLFLIQLGLIMAALLGVLYFVFTKPI